MNYAKRGYDMTFSGLAIRESGATEEERSGWWWLYHIYGAYQAHRMELAWGIAADRERRCREAADRNGVGPEQAANCWEGRIGCPDCPLFPGVPCKVCGTRIEMADDEPETECDECGAYLRNPKFRCPNGDQQIEPNPNGNW